MPRYFFNLFDDLVVLDSDGVECLDESAALALALESLRDIAAAQVREGSLSLDHRLELADASGNLLKTTTIREAVRIIG